MRNQVPENRTITRTSIILQFLRKEGSSRGVRLTDIAQGCGLEKSTTHRLLGALISEELIEQDADSERYRLGLRLLELGMAVLSRMDVRDEAQLALRALAARAEDTVHLGVASGTDVVYLEKVESPHAFQMRSRVGDRMPLHSTGIGKAILAFMPEDKLELVLAGAMERRTPGTIVTPEDLRRELERIRLRGYSTDMEENEQGVRCVGAPIFDHSLRVVGGISIAGPVFRFTQQRVAELGLQVVGTAQEISRRLGCAISPHAIRNQNRS